MQMIGRAVRTWFPGTSSILNFSYNFRVVPSLVSSLFSFSFFLLIQNIDKDGVAIIMCEPQLVSKYQALTQGKTILESSLHHNMLEHLNSEIALGTITSVQAAKDWIRSSFLYQRLQQNPNHYAIKQEGGKGWKEKIDEIILHNIGQLESSNLVLCNVTGSEDTIESTEFGDIMSKVFSDKRNREKYH